MRVLSIVTSKGGSGKSTLAAHLAVAAQRGSEAPVGLLDTDPQRTLADWCAAREDNGLALFACPPKRIADQLATLKQAGAELAIIDTPPSSVDAIEKAVAESDLVLVPVRPSPNDIRALTPTAEAIERSGKPQVFVLNGATRGALLTAQAIQHISRFGPLAPAVVHNRVAFAAGMIDGHTAMEVAGGEIGAEEIETLWRYLEGRLLGRHRERGLSAAG